MNLEHWLAFVATSSILLVIPGPTILTVISYGISQGRRATLPLVIAVACGDATALSLSLLGLGTLLAASAFWFMVVKWIGGGYLLYLGIKLLRSGATTADLLLMPVSPTSRRRLFLDTYLVTALNPKGIVFFVAFLPQFIVAGAPAPPQLAGLAATFVLLAIANAALYALFASSARRLLSSPGARRRFNLCGGSLLAAAGLWTLLVRRPA